MPKLEYDPRCEELARSFLEDQNIDFSNADVAELAGEIQTVIEEWLAVEP